MHTFSLNNQRIQKLKNFNFQIFQSYITIVNNRVRMVLVLIFKEIVMKVCFKIFRSTATGNLNAEYSLANGRSFTLYQRKGVSNAEFLEWADKVGESFRKGLPIEKNPVVEEYDRKWKNAVCGINVI